MKYLVLVFCISAGMLPANSKRLVLVRHQVKELSLTHSFHEYYERMGVTEAAIKQEFLPDSALPLSVQGWRNALDYAFYFPDTLGLTIGALYARGWGAPGRKNLYVRAWQTMLPLWNRLRHYYQPLHEHWFNRDIITRYDSAAFCKKHDDYWQYKALVQEFKAQERDVVICWERGTFCAIAQACGVRNQQLLRLLAAWQQESWGDTIYNWVFVLCFENNVLRHIDHHIVNFAEITNPGFVRRYPNIALEGDSFTCPCQWGAVICECHDPKSCMC